MRNTPEPNPVSESQQTPTPDAKSEWRIVAWASAWFFFVLLSYFIVQPVRETMAAIGGTKQLQWLMLATFAAMLVAVPLYASLVNRLPRRWLVRIVFHFFSLSLVAFSFALSAGGDGTKVWAARTFFVWVNVFALFATSVFWSVLADLFTSDEGKRLFGRIAAGGTAGGITGGLLTSQIAPLVSTSALLLIPVVTIQLGLWCAWRLERGVQRSRIATASENNVADTTLPEPPPPTGGLLQGITQVFRSSYLASICVFLFFVQAAGTLLYFQQAEVVNASIQDEQTITQFYAYVSFTTQACTLVTQLFVSGWVLRKLGVSAALMVLPCVYLASFTLLAFVDTLAVVAVAMVATRSMAYGITVPSREVLFTVVSREEKYKSKNFIDTVVLRGGDAVSSQLFGSLRNLAGLGFATLNLISLPLMFVWMYAAYRLGRRQLRLANEASETTESL